MPVLLGVLLLIGRGLDTSSVHAAEFSKDDLKTIAVAIADAHDLHPGRFLATLDCESGFDKDAVGRLGELGIAQIYPKYHPEVTKEQMLNPLWSMEWMAEQFALGNQRWWSCWKPSDVSS